MKARRSPPPASTAPSCSRSSAGLREAGDEHALDELLGQAPAAAVGHLHGGVVGDRHRADGSQGEIAGRFGRRAASRPAHASLA